MYENASTVEELRWKKFPVLDDGFVCLVDAMGDDGAIVQAARVSYGEGTRRVSDDRTLIRYLMRKRHCYDAQTEVLTDRGFVAWPDVQSEDKLGLWDEAAGSLVYEKAEYLTCDEYKGPMYRVDHGGVDLLVTPEHTMWVKRKKWRDGQMRWTDAFGLVPASELGNGSMVRYSKLAPDSVSPRFTGEGLPFAFDDPQELLRLFGFFAGDGGVGKAAANGLAFRLKKRRKREFLREVCLGLGWECRELAWPTLSARAETVSKFFRQEFYTSGGEKRLPDCIRFLCADDAKCVLEGLRASDGSLKRSTWEYSTSSPLLAQQVQCLALHAGEAVHISGPNEYGLYRLMFLSRMREPVINQSRRNTSIEQYNGKVYCAKTRTGVLVVRRNGKIVLSGNTTPFEMAEIKLLVRVPMDCWRQWIRHRTANVNEYSTRYSVAIDSAQATRPDDWRVQSTFNKQGSGEALSGWPEGYELRPARPDGTLLLGDPQSDQFRAHRTWAVVRRNDGESETGIVHLFTDASLQQITPGYLLSVLEKQGLDAARDMYDLRLDFNVAREQARKDLPLSTYTEAYWKIDLHNLFHFLGLRMDPHAQHEIRQYANVIGEDIVKPLFPVAWEAFEDYRLRGMFLTHLDQIVIDYIGSADVHSRKRAFSQVIENDDRLADWRKERCRERDECRAKLLSLGLLPS